MKSLLERASAPTPSFFKKVIKLAAIAGIIGGSLVAAPSTLGISIPIALITLGKALVLASGTAATVAKLTKEEV